MQDSLIKVEVIPQLEAGTSALRDVRKGIKARIKDGLQKGAEQVALPAVKEAAPVKTGWLRDHLAAKARANSAYITVTGGKKGRYAGLLEFGGQIRGDIRPKKKKALKIGEGFAASVTKPRRYEARAFIRDAIVRHQDPIQEAIQEEVAKAFTEVGFEEGE